MRHIENINEIFLIGDETNLIVSFCPPVIHFVHHVTSDKVYVTIDEGMFFSSLNLRPLLLYMKNKEHKKLWKTLRELKSCSRSLQQIQVSLKSNISELEHTEERLELVRRNKEYAEFLTFLNKEIRNVKLMIKECQKSFG
jgi:hypothetical protein